MPRIVVLSLLLLWILSSHTAQAQEIWSQADAMELLATVDAISEDGLDPADYDADTLRQVFADEQPAERSRHATAAFVHLASDLTSGHLRDRRIVAWRIASPGLSDTAAQRLLANALETHRVRQILLSLLPQHRQYKLLKAELAATPLRDKAGIERLRANLERWRWMPRELGSRYMLVNVPAFTVSLIEHGRVAERRRVIVGKRTTPTPQFAATVSGVIFNPWWDVPDSIVRESVGRQLRNDPAKARAHGYVATNGRVRQAPGPGNALGQVKLVMPNPYSVYLHDTPNKQLFDDEVRAFSHGCIRVQDARGLAASLLRDTGSWTRQDIDRSIAAKPTLQVNMRNSIPVYVVYFTAAAEENGAVATFPDIYGRDGPVVAALVVRQIDLGP